MNYFMLISVMYRDTEETAIGWLLKIWTSTADKDNFTFNLKLHQIDFNNIFNCFGEYQFIF